MGAFAAAANRGFAIECDLQISATGVPVVFHDPALDRMTSVSGQVRDRTPQQLAQLNLLETNDTIQPLSEHLKLVAGRVPVVLELKGVEGADAGFVEGVARAVKDYEGQLAVMSFDHWICAQFAKLLPGLPRGLTAEGDDTCYDSHVKAMTAYDLQFISYSVRDLPCRFVAEARDHGLPVITWTVKDRAAEEKTAQFADQMTFEGFDPFTGTT